MASTKRAGALRPASILRTLTRRPRLRRRAAATGAARFFDVSNDLPCTASLDGWFLELNGRWEETLGWSTEELRRRPFVDFVHADDRARTREAVAQLARGAEIVDFLNRYAAKDGTWRWLEWRAAVDAESGVIYASARDASARMEAEQVRRLLGLVVEQSEDAIVAKDLEGTITRWNRGAERIYGYTAAEAIGRPIGIIIPEERMGEELTILRRIGAGRSVPQHHTKRRRKDGTVIDVSVTVSPIQGEDGTIVGASAITRDVTASERLRAELETANARLQAVLDHSPTAIFLRDLEGRFALANPRAAQALGRTGDQVVGRRLDELVPLTVAETIEANDHEVVRTGAPALFEELLPDPDDPARLRPYLSTKFPVRDRSGNTIGIGGVALDISERVAMEEAVRAAEERFRTAFEEAPIGMALFTLEGSALRINRTLSELLGLSAEELGERGLAGGIHPEDVDIDRELVHELLAGTRRSYHVEKRLVHRSGRLVWTSITVRLVRGAGGEPVHLIAQVEDITERKRAEFALQKAQERFRITVTHAPIGVALVGLADGRAGRVLTVNDALCRLLGRSSSDLVGRELGALVHPAHRDAVERDLALLATHDDARVELEVRCRRRRGETVWVALSGATVPSDDASPRLAVLHLMDVSERKRFEGELQRLADHDALTGLFNRRRFTEELEWAVADARRYGKRGALLMVDLDGFKEVNDSLGHSFGDEMITRVGALLEGRLRETDVVGRLGGDEFAVILPEADRVEALGVGEKLVASLRDRSVVVGDEGAVRITASIGVTTFDGDTALTAEELLVEADGAMYEAKGLGKNQVAVAGREGRGGPLLPRQSQLDRMKSALRDGDFVLMAQPVRGICSDGIDRYEILLRLRGDRDQLLEPSQFLYDAERFDLVQQIDRWVFSEAARLLALHRAAGEDISLSLNMSGKTLGDPQILADITAMLEDLPVPRDRLVVEVTETAAIVNIQQARTVARGLRELGCCFALDDFGAGFASFYYLKHLEFDYLKIDGEFIKTLVHNATDRLVVQSMVDVARGLGTETIAEFVQDEATLALLREFGVDYGQGYHLGEPEPVADILPALAGA